MNSFAEQTAREIIEVLPLVLRVIRGEIRRSRFPSFSLPQFRALAFLGRNRGAMLTDLADHLGMSLPSASKLIDALVSARMVSRKTDPNDRRRVVLVLTTAGEKKYQIASDAALQMLASKVSRLSDEQNVRIIEAMKALRSVFTERPIGRETTTAPANGGAAPLSHPVTAQQPFPTTEQSHV